MEEYSEWDVFLLSVMTVSMFIFTVSLGNLKARLFRQCTFRTNVWIVVVSLVLVVASMYGFWHPSDVESIRDLGGKCSVLVDQGEEQQSSIRVVMHFDENQRSVGSITAKMNQDYCRAQGYQFVRHTGCEAPLRHPQWVKIAILHEEVTRGGTDDKHQWVIWIDADAMFLNHRYDLAGYLSKMPEHILVVIGPDVPGAVDMPINTGWMAWRKTSAAVGLLLRIWEAGVSLRLRKRWAHEQQSLVHLMTTQRGVKEQVYIASEDSPGIRCFAEDVGMSGWWNRGMLVAHAAGWKGSKLRAVQIMSKYLVR